MAKARWFISHLVPRRHLSEFEAIVGSGDWDRAEAGPHVMVWRQWLGHVWDVRDWRVA